MINETFQRRFRELEAKMSSLPFESNYGSSGTHVPQGPWQQWATSAQNLILAVFGEKSPHYANFVSAFKDCGGYDYEIHV
jgi:hypothetical protein